MSLDIPESDWRRFREIQKEFLARYCSRTLEEVADASQGTEGSSHDRHLRLCRLITQRDQQLARAFSVHCGHAVGDHTADGSAHG